MGARALQLVLRCCCRAVSAVDPDGTTPLHWAAYNDDVDGARRLLQQGPTSKLRIGTVLLRFRWHARTAARAWFGCCWMPAPTRTLLCPVARRH